MAASTPILSHVESEHKQVLYIYIKFHYWVTCGCWNSALGHSETRPFLQFHLLKYVLPVS